MQFYFVRHGESVANLLHEFSNRGCKHPLTEKGRLQASELGDRLKGKHLIHIYSSPLLRAQQTSQILAEIWHLDITITDALREFDVGIYEGTSDSQGWEDYREVVHVWLWENNRDRRLPEGESFQDLLDRFIPFIEDLKTKYKDTEGAILLVGHGGLYRCVLPYVLTNISYDFCEQHPIDNVSFIVTETNNNELICLSWCGYNI